MALMGKEYLKTKIDTKKRRVKLRYDYYEMKNGIKYLRGTIPSNFTWMSETLGWCAKATDSIADRLMFYKFDNDNYEINDIYSMNNADILFDSAILSSLIASCSFIYVYKDGSEPKLQVIDGANATGIIDPTTYMLKEGYAVLERDSKGNIVTDAYFTAESTTFFTKGEKTPRVVANIAPYPLLVPIIYRPDAKRPFGHSRISRACMDITQSALRTLLRSEVSAEFYSYPQKYVLGLENEAEWNSKAATMSSFLSFANGENGDKPTVGQFNQQSMSPYVDLLKAQASLFAGETGLTMDDLGFNTVNPSSSEAIKASHENLRLTTRKAQRTFGTGFLNAGYLAACLRDDFAYDRSVLHLTTPLWEPMFEPDAAQLSTIGDGVIKINQAVPGYFGKDNLRNLTGIKATEENIIPTEE